MGENQHKTHTELARPVLGNFSRNEWALVGAPCTVIKVLADAIIKTLTPRYSCAYVDTLHADDATQLPGRLASGAIAEYTDQLNYSRVNLSRQLNMFEQRRQFADADVVLVNGNHQQAKAQVVIVDENKMASLQKRVGQLTNVQLFLLADNSPDLFDFLKEALPHWQTIPVLPLNDTAAVISFFEKELLAARPKLNGLVLAGGKSQRMGFDKSSVKWHNTEQRYHVADMLKDLCSEVFISCRAGQFEQHVSYRTLEDTFTGLGPFGGILSAFREQPDSAWLVVATDLPLVNMATLQHLVSHRNTAKNATAFKGHQNFPEPLISIWEPKSYTLLLSFLAQGYSCPRKVLINSEIELLEVPDPETLTNVNTPAELEHVKAMIHMASAK